MNMKVIQLAVGWLAQLIEHCTGIAKARKKKKKEKKETLLTHHNTFTVNLLAFL